MSAKIYWVERCKELEALNGDLLEACKNYKEWFEDNEEWISVRAFSDENIFVLFNETKHLYKKTIKAITKSEEK